jgi:ribosomal protein S18 acetylase RimI-like enzyme
VNSARAANVGWVVDHFLGECLGRKVLRLQSVDAVPSALDELRGHASWMIEIRVPVDGVQTLAVLTKQGFGLVDTNVQLDCPASQLRNLPWRSDVWTIRAAQAADRNAVSAIATTQLTLSRFHLDPQVDARLASEVKRAWVDNFFESKRGDGLFVVDDGQIAGFLLVLERGTLGVIDLIAVAPRIRGSGAVAALISAWLDKSPAIDRIVVGTQIANVRSLRAYSKLGFRVCGATHVLHRHSGNCDAREEG